ncbi:hypothetical protein CFP56_032136 [Quercus suber]|uniref:Uncharacterized protein n=1 Tax=Quercus suber TaxID=58331 RepID=A0AAW0JIL3_QUESU
MPRVPNPDMKKGVWKLKVPLHIRSLIRRARFESLPTKLAQQDQSCFDLFAMMVSLIWMRRNKARVEEESYLLA